jgi:transcriptional regulator with XRE-family HTH domain
MYPDLLATRVAGGWRPGGKVDGDEWMVIDMSSAKPLTPAQIGARVRYWREKKGLNLETAAGLAGISKSYLGRLENGKRHFNRRGLLEDIALAIGCSVAVLTDPKPGPAEGGLPGPAARPGQQPYQLVARSNQAAATVIPQIRTALMHCTLDDVPDVPTRPIRELVAAARLATKRLFEAGRDDLASQGLADLMIELQVTAATTTNGADKLAALAALVEACMVAEDVAFTCGELTLAVLAAERGREAAERLGDPAMIGLAAWTLGGALQVVGAHRRAANMLTGVIDSLAGVDPTGTDTLAAEAYGFAHLRSGLLAAKMGRGNAAYDHLGEAARIAVHTGESNAYEHFGMSYVAIWRLRVGVELQEGGRAYERAHTANIDPARLSAHNTISLHLYSARALAQEGGRRDEDAARHLYLADRSGPHRVRYLPMANQVFAELDSRAPRNSWRLESLRDSFGSTAVKRA